jgi:hypothetical protein
MRRQSTGFSARSIATPREIACIDAERRKMKPHPWNVVRHKISGPTLERWCLKTQTNLCCDGDYPIGRDSNVRGRPSERLVRVACGHESFVNRAGLYFAVRVGMKTNSSDAVGFAPLILTVLNLMDATSNFGRSIGFLCWAEMRFTRAPPTSARTVHAVIRR